MKKPFFLTTAIILSVFISFAQGGYNIEFHELPYVIKYEGELQEARTWIDSNGENFFIITKVEEYVSKRATDKYDTDKTSSYLYAYHYIDNGGSMKLSRKITDFVKDCEFDITIFHEPNSIEITDLDNDDIKEVSFVYKLSCKSDVSGDDMKLMLLEDGKKYPIRGTSEMRYNDDYAEPGTKKLGVEFDKAPKSFKKFAEEQWEKFNYTEF